MADARRRKVTGFTEPREKAAVVIAGGREA